MLGTHLCLLHGFWAFDVLCTLTERFFRAQSFRAPLNVYKSAYTSLMQVWWLYMCLSRQITAIAELPSQIHNPNCRFLACPECKIHASRDIILWYDHSCSLLQGARALHDAVATHQCPSVAAHLLPTHTITRFVLHGETKKSSCPATGKAKPRDVYTYVRGFRREKQGKHL